MCFLFLFRLYHSLYSSLVTAYFPKHPSMPCLHHLMYFNHKNDQFVHLPSVTLSAKRGGQLRWCREEKVSLVPFTCYSALHKVALSSNSKPRKPREMLSQTGNTLACWLTAGSWINTVVMLCSAFKMLLVSLDKVGLEEGTTDRTDVADSGILKQVTHINEVHISSPQSLQDS